MRIGVPKEIKPSENRVGLTTAGVSELVKLGHEVFVQAQAGIGIGLSDEDYIQAGARVMPSAAEIYSAAQLIVKVKEPLIEECALLQRGQILFTFLHLAAAEAQAKLLQTAGVTAIAYETITDAYGGLPLLAPMSEVAGRLSVQAGARALEAPSGGAGILLGGVPGVAPAQVVVLGGGVVGLNAARIAMGMGARVILLDKSLPRLRHIDEAFGSSITTLYASGEAIQQQLPFADLIIGAALVPGAAAPKLISREQLALIRPGRVLVDVAIDQGGCFASSRATSHQQPTYVEQGVIHYCVSNMPGAVAKTSTYALTNATLPFVLSLANYGLDALRKNSHLRSGLNVFSGHITCKAVADALGTDYEYISAELLL